MVSFVVYAAICDDISLFKVIIVAIPWITCSLTKCTAWRGTVVSFKRGGGVVVPDVGFSDVVELGSGDAGFYMCSELFKELRKDMRSFFDEVDFFVGF